MFIWHTTMHYNAGCLASCFYFTVWMCIEQGDYIGALTLICEKHNPRFPELYHLMAGWCHFAMSRYNLALAHFSSCLSCEQMMACAMNCMSMCYRRLGQCDLELKMLHYLCEVRNQIAFIWQYSVHAITPPSLHQPSKYDSPHDV